jgi:hypothetical protein
MKKHIIAAAIVVASLVYSTILIAQPSPGFSKTAPIQGTGSSGSPIAITACSAGSGYVHSGAAWACALIGDITGITAGSGVHASSTTASGAATLAIDPTYTQRRISTDCGAGSAVRSVAEDGTPTCISAGGASLSPGTNINITLDTINLNDTVTLAGQSDTDTLNVLNSATGQTASVRLVDVTPSGTYNVASGDLNEYGVYSASTATYSNCNLVESSCTTQVNKYAFYANPSDGANNGTEVWSFYGANGKLHQVEEATFGGTVGVTGNVLASAAVQVNGNALFGDNAADTVEVTGDLTVDDDTLMLGDIELGDSSADVLTIDATTTHTAPTTVAEFRGTQTDASVSGTQTDWALSASATVFRINFTASTDVLSIANGAAGREIEIVNVGSATPRFFSDYAVGTTAAMRIVLDATYSYLAPGAGLKLRYDATSSRWRQVSNSSFYVYRLTTVNNLTADGSFEALTSAVNTYQPFTTTVTANLGDGDADIVNIRGVAKDTSTAVAPTTCGTSPTVTGGSTAFVVTTGSGATGCILTFSGTKTNVPTCVVSGQNSTEFAYTVSATAITLGSGTAASTKYDVICVGDG